MNNALLRVGLLVRRFHDLRAAVLDSSDVTALIAHARVLLSFGFGIFPLLPCAAQPLAALLPYGCGVPLAGRLYALRVSLSRL